jgi:N-acetylglucosamine-6-sulfatase
MRMGTWGAPRRRLAVALAVITLVLILAAGLPASAAGSITSFDPNHGQIGTSVVITGVGFTGATAVRFNGVNDPTFVIDTDEQITATVPDGATTGPLEIDMADAETAASAESFTIDDPPPLAPTIDNFSPRRGPEAAPVVLHGSGLSTTTDVRFAGRTAGFTVNGDDQITAYVPAGADSGRISVDTPFGTATTEDPFVVQPNIVVIVSDDQRYDELSHMPIVQSELISQGVRFTNGFVSNPLCCPSRVSILTGRYSHSTGVYSNGGEFGGIPVGGFPAFDAGRDSGTMAAWLDDAGYETGLVGKYLNHYGPNPDMYIPPGWDRWVSFNEDNGLYYNYDLNVDGDTLSFGSGELDYSTDVFARYADTFIQQAPADRPIFLFFTPYAPHGPSTPPPRYQGDFSNEPGLRLPSFNEADVSDKPAYIRNLRSLNSKKIASGDLHYRRVLESLLGVDDAVGTIINALEDTGRLENTLIFYISDNGVQEGEHRWGFKVVPYDESIRVPFIVRWDRLANTPRTDSNLVLNVDIAPTVAQAADAPAPAFDGNSLLPQLTGASTTGRPSILLESYTYARPDGSVVPSYCGIRTKSRLFVHYATGEEEYYTLSTDPYELRNKVKLNSAGAAVRNFRAQARAQCVPRPPGMPSF